MGEMMLGVEVGKPKEQEMSLEQKAAQVYGCGRFLVQATKEKFMLTLEGQRAGELVGNLKNTLVLRAKGNEAVLHTKENEELIMQAEALASARQEEAKARMDEVKAAAQGLLQRQTVMTEALIAAGMNPEQIAAIQKQAKEDEKQQYYQEYAQSYREHMSARVKSGMTVGTKQEVWEAAGYSNRTLFEFQDMIQMGEQVFGENRLGRMGDIEVRIKQEMQQQVVGTLGNLILKEKMYYQMLDGMKDRQQYGFYNQLLWQVHDTIGRVKDVLTHDFNMRSDDLMKFQKAVLNPGEARQMLEEDRKAKAESKPDRMDKRVVKWLKGWTEKILPKQKDKDGGGGGQVVAMPA